jgi:hypothetical protein
MCSLQKKIAAWVLTASLANVASAFGGPEQYSVQNSVQGPIQPPQSLVVSPPAVQQTYVPGGQYPQLGAPLYPSPVQYTPPYNGGTIITNQAFAPHEALYPHTYHAMYPPFYYKVKGGWFWTPLGVRQHENWKLQGTEVLVKYRSHYPLFGGFHPPCIR